MITLATIYRIVRMIIIPYIVDENLTKNDEKFSISVVKKRQRPAVSAVIAFYFLIVRKVPKITDSGLRHSTG